MAAYPLAVEPDETGTETWLSEYSTYGVRLVCRRWHWKEGAALTPVVTQAEASEPPMTSHLAAASPYRVIAAAMWAESRSSISTLQPTLAESEAATPPDTEYSSSELSTVVSCVLSMFGVSWLWSSPCWSVLTSHSLSYLTSKFAVPAASKVARTASGSRNLTRASSAKVRSTPTGETGMIFLNARSTGLPNSSRRSISLASSNAAAASA
mmetsp:Transcript_12443/g.39659  ORF Transcript_12443/g.39659 Transcript_12443/m.39659 type:complete len:210 (-) Transcript_12443:295-924(-)